MKLWETSTKFYATIHMKVSCELTMVVTMSHPEGISTCEPNSLG